jgi:hypothetical protein
MQCNNLIQLQTSRDDLFFDSQTGRLVSFRCRQAPDQEFLAFSEAHPAFVVGYFDVRRKYHLLPSSQSASIKVEIHRDGDDRVLKADYFGLADQDLDVSFQVRITPDSPFSRWTISLDNRSGMEIFDLQFPFLVCAYDLAGEPESESLVLPQGYGSGQLIKNFKGEEAFTWSSLTLWRQKLLPDSWTTWSWHEWNYEHYPGWQFAQFLAYYNDRCGIYLACNDTEGRVKRFKILHRDPGFRLGVSHIGDWPANGQRSMEYEVLLGSFQGDWYDAAEIYRSWSLQQRWATPIHKRDDMPAWLKDSPVYITVRPQGILDEGPVVKLDEFLPYEKCLPLLEQIEKKVEAPLAVIFMGWEKHGSWVFPDCFPPIGGEDSMKAFTREARRRGWHVGTFGNGTQWLVGDGWNNHDGQVYFQENGGPDCACVRPDGSLWYLNAPWRPGYFCCLGSPITRQNVTNTVQTMLDYGWESIQYFDQNCFAVTFACFGEKHDHPPLPGKWMTERMESMLKEVQALALQKGETGAIQSVEAGVNEYCLPLFQECDVRVFPPGTAPEVIPLLNYLFHENIILQGMMSYGPEPHHLAISAAANCILGEIPGGVLRGDGTLLDRDTNNWAPWEPKVGDQQEGLEMIRTVTALRRGPGKDFLVYGRMLRPANIADIPIEAWEYNGKHHKIPAVFHSAWQAPDGRKGFILANWTDRDQNIVIKDPVIYDTGAQIRLMIFGKEKTIETLDSTLSQVEIQLPPLSCAVVDINL